MSADALRTPVVSLVPAVLLGPSAVARQLDEDIRAAAAAESVLVEGEAGLEFGDVARAIHDRSGRPGACVVLDAGAESRVAPLERALERAHRGTLYLGDLSELRSVTQARLARVARAVEVLLIAGLSADLASEISEGRLRRDIVRRFMGARVTVPPLRNRVEDIPTIIDALVSRVCDEAGIGHKRLTQRAVTLLSGMPWHGNLVELRHAIRQIVGAVATDTIDLADVLAHLRFDGAPTHGPTRTLRSARQQFEREYIVLVLRHHRGSVGDAARALGIQRTNLYRKARQLGLRVARPVQQP
jgi:two-component system, NtrC family, nitrogen regulation response regulator NtrX